MTENGRPDKHGTTNSFWLYLECGDSGKRLQIALDGAEEFGFKVTDKVVQDRLTRKSLATGQDVGMTTYNVFFQSDKPVDLCTYNRFLERIQCVGDHDLDFWD